MLFILRCVFWLMIVYASMTWTSGDLRTRTWQTESAKTARAGAMPAGDALADKAAANAIGYCRRFPAGCLDGATRLTAILGSATTETPKEGAASIFGESDLTLPLPAPRRHARGAVSMQAP